ncbi:MAG: UDP-N-acetylmuramate dehydrogenase [Clostridia bacterium]|nr:UDP-N-acetylmuramate dehydrogenase [Clostridia bacterium]
MIPNELFERLTESGIEYRRNTSLKPFSTFRVGGEGVLVILPDSRETLCRAVAILRERETPFEVIGNGSNVLFGDGTLERVLIVTRGIAALQQTGNQITAGCGASLAALAACAAEASLSGLEFARGIPGTVGGALFMNAGAYGGAMSDVVTESLALDTESGRLLTLTDHGFGYRTSVYMNNPRLICLGGTFSLTPGDKRAIEEKMRELAVSRKEKQPLEYPSAGSYFKRPEGHFAGKLIEDCGLKGTRIGGAAVSQKHAGFLINLGGATAEDVLRLEELVRAQVLSRFGVELEREVRWIR